MVDNTEPISRTVLDVTRLKNGEKLAGRRCQVLVLGTRVPDPSGKFLSCY